MWPSELAWISMEESMEALAWKLAWKKEKYHKTATINTTKSGIEARRKWIRQTILL